MIATPIQGWREACDEVVSELLDQIHQQRPPVDAFNVARHLNVEVVLDQSLIGRARYKRLGGRATVFLKPDERPERLQWALAHELGEQLAHRVFQKLDQESQGSGLEPRRRDFGGHLREQVASEIAGRILLPRAWFFGAIEQFDSDLFALKELFSTASHELILLGMLRWPEQSVVTVFDNRQVTRRFGNRETSPAMTPLEYDVWEQCHRSGRVIDCNEDGVRVQAWPIHEDDWQRELLRTTACEWTHEVQPDLFELQCS